MAHDLRSPLNTILLLADSMRRGQGGPLTAAQRHHLGLIYSAALCVTEAASDVVELARGGGRLTQHEPAMFCVPETLTAVRDLVLPVAEEKGLEVRLTDEVPEPTARLGHARALARVLLNLTTNALRFTTVGFVEVSAQPAAPGSNTVRFAVRDTGPGIPRSKQLLLYEPFRREDARTLFARPRDLPPAGPRHGRRAGAREPPVLGHAVLLRDQPPSRAGSLTRRRIPPTARRGFATTEQVARGLLFP